MRYVFIITLLTLFIPYYKSSGQKASTISDVEIIDSLDISQAPAGKITKYWLHIVSNGLSQPVYIPVMVARGEGPGPVLGLTAAIHGNELNGIVIVQNVFQAIDVQSLKGTLIGVPGLNVPGILNGERTFPDLEDLNRLFPGKSNGNSSEQYVFNIFQKVIKNFNYLIDMHTASFGRINSYYVRADMSQDTLAHLTRLQNARIILNNAGLPSAGSSAGGRTLRAEASLAGIPTLTVEYGNPQVYQKEIIEKGVTGVLNAMSYLKMINRPIEGPETPAILCQRSYWIYTDEGGMLEVLPALGQLISESEKIAVLKNAFGDTIKEYFAPEAGVVIGKSTNPVNQAGGRIIHLGILSSP